MAIKELDYTPIISFCHFCEIHGPSTVFSTQSFIESTTRAMSYDISYQLDNDSRNDIDDRDRNHGQTTLTDNIVSEDNETFSSARAQLRALFFGLKQLRIDCSGGAEFIDEKDLKICEGCSLTPRSLMIKNFNVGEQDAHLYKGYVTNDQISRRKYITANEPLCYRSLIKQACVRSLSCETYPQEKEGAIYFGDDIRWHNLSWLFVLKDSKARGFNRTYSIIISHPTKAHLMSSWKLYNKHINNIIDNLKQKSAQIFKKEIATMDCKQQRWSIPLNRVAQFGYPSNMNSNLMTRVARYNNQLRPTSTIQPCGNSNTTSSVSNMEDSSDDRSLSDIDSMHGTPVKSKDQSFSKSATATSSSGISSSSGSKLATNKSAFSQPSTSGGVKLSRHRDVTNTQRGNSEARSLIDLTADELIFANLHLLFCHILKLTSERFMQTSPHYEVDRLSSFSNIRTNRNHSFKTRQLIENITTESQLQTNEPYNDAQHQQEPNQSDIMSRSSQIITLERINLGNNLSWKDANYFTTLRHMYMFLGRDKFKIIGYHTIIGSKIVIICKYRDFLCEFMKCLAMLLPIERLQDIPKRETLVDDWKLNIIGVVGNKLPNSVLESNYQLLIDISDRNTVPSVVQEHMNNSRLLTSLWPQTSRSASQPSVSYTNALGSTSSAFKVTTSNYRVTLHSKEKMPPKLPQFLTNLMEIIKNVFYSDSCLERYLIATKEEWLTNAKMIWAITRNNPSEKRVSDISQIYHLFNIEDCDQKLIRYWADADMTFKLNAIKLA